MIEPARIMDMLIEFARRNSLDSVEALQQKLETRFPDHSTNVTQASSGDFTLIVDDVTLTVNPTTVQCLS